jgi:outer membrane receptor protein involved in Fe transport
LDFIEHFRIRLLRAGCGVSCRVLLLVAAVLALAQAAHAQAAKGGIRGSVVDSEFGGGVPGATVTVEGPNITVQTGDDGGFVVSELPPGTYDILVARDGYIRSRVPGVVVGGGAFAETRVPLAAEVFELEDFIVSQDDLLGGDEAVQLLNVQQNLTSISNVLGADFISKIGASDVGKALQKVSGVSVIGDRYVVVRGLADRYNVILMNGMPVPSSDPDRRAVNIDLFPASIVRALETGKTFTPDLPGEATGGTIDILTKSVPEENYTKVKIGLGYDNLATGNSDFLTYPGGGTSMLGTLDSRRLPASIRNAELSPIIAFGSAQAQDQRFRDEINSTLPRTMGATKRAPGPDLQFELDMGRRFKFWGLPAGLLVGFDYRKQYRFEPDGLEARYSFAGNGRALAVRRRLQITRGTETLRGSLLAVLGIEPQKGDEVKVTLFSNRSAQDRATIRVGPAGFPPGDVPEGTDGLYRESLAYTERRLSMLQIAGRHHWKNDDAVESTVLRWGTSYNLSSQDEPDHRFTQSDTTPDFATYYFPGALPIPPVRRYWRELDDTRWNLGLELDQLLFKREEKDTWLKIGGGFDHTSRDYRADNFAYNINEESTPFPGPLKPAPYGDATLADVWNYGNKQNIDQVARPDLGHYLFRFTPPEKYRATQTIPWGFVFTEADFSESFNATFGLRFEQTSIDIEATDISEIEEGLGIAFLPKVDRTPQNVNDLLAGGERAKNNPAIQAARFAKIHESHVLPAVALKFRLTDTMNLRGGWSRTIARPSFKELAPVLFRDAESGDLFGGNAELKISNIDNYDVRWEWYPASGGLVALNFFSKFIQNPIERTNLDGLDRFVNGNDAVIYGAEIEIDQNLGFLSDAFRHFSVGMNYAWMKSVAERETDSQYSRTRRLQGQPDYTFNFNLTYDHPDTGLSAGIFLNVTGPYLESLGAGPVADIFVEPQTTLNAFIAWKFPDAGKLTLRAGNLTSPQIRKVYDNRDRDIYEISNTSTTYSISYENTF